MVMDGSTEIDGYAFAKGLDSFSYAQHTDLQALVPTAASLIREAIFRSKTPQRSHGRFSLNIRPLGELMSMYHNRDASLRADKVFALLGMSSDASIPPELSPNYQVAWGELFKSLIAHALQGASLSMMTWDDREIAIILVRGVVLGEVAAVRTGPGWQSIDITLSGFNDTLVSWVLPLSAKPVLKGDVVCSAEGALRPMVVRASTDFWHVIIISFDVSQSSQMAVGSVGKKVGHDLLCVWDWGNTIPATTRHGQQDFETTLGLSSTRQQDILVKLPDQCCRLESVSKALQEVKRYRDAADGILDALEITMKAYGEHNDLTAAKLKRLSLILRSDEQRPFTEELLARLVDSRRQISRAAYPTLIEGMSHLAFLYKQEELRDVAERMEDMAAIVNRANLGLGMAAGQAVRIARKYDAEVMKLIFKVGGGGMDITEGVISAAASNEDHGLEVMRVLLHERRDEFKITTAVIVATVCNERNGLDILRLILEAKDEIKLSPSVIAKAAHNPKCGTELLSLLLGQKRQQKEKFVVTSYLVQEIHDKHETRAVMRLLIDDESNFEFTEDGAISVAEYYNKDMVIRLLDRRSNRVNNTKKLFRAAGKNYKYGMEITQMLMERKRSGSVITV